MRRKQRSVSSNNDLTRLSADIDDPVYRDRAARPRDRARTHDGRVVAIFNDLAEACAEFVAGADAVVGCVAWLTNPTVLRTFAKLPAISLIVQKEDFLRPDSGASDEELRAAYTMLHGLDRELLPQSRDIAYAWGDKIEPVRCVGIENHTQRKAVPRMHHKYLVRLAWENGNADEPILGYDQGMERTNQPTRHFDVDSYVPRKAILSDPINEVDPQLQIFTRKLICFLCKNAARIAIQDKTVNIAVLRQCAHQSSAARSEKRGILRDHITCSTKFKLTYSNRSSVGCKRE